MNLGKQKRRLSRFTSYLTTTLVLIILGLGGYLVFVKHRYFDIQNLQVTGTKSFVSETDLLEVAKSRAYGHNLLSFDTSEFELSLMDTFQGAREIYASKKLPNVVKIEIIEREPLAIIHNLEREHFFLIDGDGYVLGQIEPGTSNFPEISYSGAIEVGYFLEKEIVSVYFELLSSLDNEKLSASSMSVSPRYVSLYTDDSIEVLVGKDKDIPQIVSVLSDLLKQLSTEGKDVKRVDLRYDKVIVSYR
ncbi:FtsQ-type POTRA domain-containing protein [candidate division WWE3 bacterium]|nr:FtsQ-type POTRA domain-containing protein [candidate division WWE3 bacterium]